MKSRRLAGINQQYARRFLSGLIAEKRILVQKIPREKGEERARYMRGA
ncbi:MAG TPA: hypothetical protein VN956_14890 [Pyrinomonadaceae bacterium]|nr:hypothetical protein [Pyrinomonadaceae bacterium]